MEGGLSYYLPLLMESVPHREDQGSSLKVKSGNTRARHSGRGLYNDIPTSVARRKAKGKKWIEKKKGLGVISSRFCCESLSTKRELTERLGRK